MEPQYFLKIDGIVGESTKIGHKGEIEMDDWSFGETQSGTSHYGTGGAAGRVSMQDFRFSKRFDRSSPKLMEYCCTGKHVPKATFVAQRTGTIDGKMMDYLIVTFEDLIFSSYDTNGTGSGDFPRDNISFNFAKVCYEYRQIDKGKVVDTRLGGYDIKQSRTYAVRAS